MPRFNVYQKYELSLSLKRNIKRKEKKLGRTCRKIWEHTNPEGQRYLYANFCKDYDKLVVTIAYYEKRIHAFYPCY